MPRARTVDLQPNVDTSASRDMSTAASRTGLLAGLGYVGAGIVTLGGLAMIVDSSVSLGTRVLVGALIMIAMRNTVRPTPVAPPVRPTSTPRHRGTPQAKGDRS